MSALLPFPDDDDRVHFDGETYDPALDWSRLTHQIERIRALMLDGKWRSAREVEEILGHSTASASARIRDLRKDKFGSHKVESRRRDGTRSTWEYRVHPAGSGVPASTGPGRELREARARIAELEAEVDALIEALEAHACTSPACPDCCRPRGER